MCIMRKGAILNLFKSKICKAVISLLLVQGMQIVLFSDKNVFGCIFVPVLGCNFTCSSENSFVICIAVLCI